ncbi:hypothetical protein [uncultured Luteimonas sp.]|uniref:hypothetical protein n=1 Tax=uncultured Luteimonas sp. TaxID=453144 RepID=UPI002630054E|nr:hypothetical protein [uncultured Luteimonas sp.]
MAPASGFPRDAGPGALVQAWIDQAMERTPYENPTAETFHASRVSGAVVWIAAMLGLAVALSGVPGLLKTLLLMSWLAVEPAMHLESPWEAVLELVFSVTAIAAGAALAGRYRVALYLLGLLAGMIAWLLLRKDTGAAEDWPWLALYAAACIACGWMRWRGHLRPIRAPSPMGDPTAAD